MDYSEKYIKENLPKADPDSKLVINQFDIKKDLYIAKDYKLEQTE